MVQTQRHIRAVVIVSVLATCSSWHGFNAANAADLAVVAPMKACADLEKLDLSRSDAGPIRIDSAKEITEAGKAFCIVRGYVAPQVNFEVRLPVQGWTQRYLQLGCGGYCGGVTLTSPSAFRQAKGCAPIEDQAMVVASSDLGHRRSATFFADGVWAVNNPGAVVEFAYSGNHKTALAVKRLIREFYGQAPRYSYFNGCSDGGRQGLQEAQRFPDDFDGVLAGSTTIDVVATNTFFHAWNVRVNSRPDGRPILTASKIPGLAQAVLKACAGADGLIEDPRACTFDVSAATCPEGRDEASCLTVEQADVARKIWKGVTDETGSHLFPGGLPFGSELSWIGSMVPQEETAANTVATSGDYQWSWDFPSFMSDLGVSTGITNRNMEFTRASYDRLMKLQGLYDPTNPDIKAFAARGGKLVMWHGWADTGSSPLGSLNYAEAVRAHLGEQAAGDVLSLYLVPGAYHCSSGPIPVTADYMSQLIAWVEDGRRPGEVKVSFEAGPKDATVTKTINVPPYYAAPATRSASNRTEWLGLANYKPGGQTWCDWQSSNLVCEAR